MIEQSAYDKLREKYSKDASWAIWEPIGDTPTSNVGDMSVFDEPFIDKLNSNFVLVALNKSGDSDNVQETKDWGNFHSEHRGTCDHRLRYAISGTVIEGSYMTDIIKKHIESDSSILVKDIKSNEEKLAENIESFKDELNILGGKPTIIAFGDDAYNWVADNFGDKYDVYKLTHYSYRWKGFNKEKLKEEVEELIEKIN